MRVCPICAASNPDASKFCSECGKALAAPSTAVTPAPSSTVPPLSDHKPKLDAEALATGLVTKLDALRARRQADIMFVLDCTGSMQGEIDAIRDGILSFADTIQTDGVRARVGLVAFRDRLIGEEAEVLQFGGQPFTNQPDQFRGAVMMLEANGGGDAPESSLDAVLVATRQPFGMDGERVLVLVTDAPPHIPDREACSVDEVTVAMRNTGISQCYVVMRTADPDSQVYLKLLEGRKGMVFDLGEGDDFRSRANHFKRALMALGKTISEATR